MTETDVPQLVEYQLDHPAKWSEAVLQVLRDVVDREALTQDRRLRVLDPFAGVGRLRLAQALGADAVYAVEGVELQPEWGDEGTLPGDATSLPADWSGRYDAVVTSPCYGNRMADHHDASDPCQRCGGTGYYSTQRPPDFAQVVCRQCKGAGLSWRNTYAHALRRQGADVIPGSAATLQWGTRYREVHTDALSEMLRVTVEGGLVVVNMSNHIRDGVEQPVVEWWVNQLLHRRCLLIEVRRVRTPRQRNGANGELRVDGEVVIVARTPNDRTLL